MPIKISIPGGNGRMGRSLIKEIVNDKSLKIASSSCLPDEVEKGFDLGTLVGENKINKYLTEDKMSIFNDTDVIIDFTIPEASIFHVEKAALYNIPIVIGTTGFTNSELKKIKFYSNKIPIIHSANFSIGISLMKKLIKDSTEILGKKWEIEILETHHNKKIDSPSGTALLLGAVAAEVRKQKLDQIKKPSRDGIIGKRSKEEIGFAVLRGGNVIGEHSIKFFCGDERLEINHVANDRSIFAKGAVRSAIWATKSKPGFFTLDDVLN